MGNSIVYNLRLVGYILSQKNVVSFYIFSVLIELLMLFSNISRNMYLSIIYLLVTPLEIYPTILPPITIGCHICIIVYLLKV